jgi:rod shape-determining protein MreC
MLLKRPHYFVLGGVILLTIVLLKLPTRTATNLKLAVSGLFLPLFGLSRSTDHLAEAGSYAAVPRHQLIQRLAALEQEKKEQQVQAMQVTEITRENARLRQLLGLRQQVRWKMKLAKVIARDPANWWKTVRIDLGSRDGVRTNATVLVAQGLVGRVSDVGFATSQVVLLGDPDCRVSVAVVTDTNTRELWLIAPSSSSPLDNTLVELNYLPRHSKLSAGMTVVTSGQGGIFPTGILVGQIADFRTIGFGLYKEARVSLAVKMSTLEEVFVMMP